MDHLQSSINFNHNLCTLSLNDDIRKINNTRLTLLPAYPSFDDHHSNTIDLQDHLLLANVPRHLLTDEQQRRYLERNNILASFQILDQKDKRNLFSSIFLRKYHQLFVDLSHRLHINNAIIDYNYQRLFKCFELMTNERIYYGFQNHIFSDGNILPIDEYPIALEFFLQIDINVFFMKTCSFRNAIAISSLNFEGIFCSERPYASYGMAPCRKTNCHFCYPPMDVPNRARKHQPVVQFSPALEHIFVNGYRTILNCPTTCQTKGILYALTCPCGNYDYIGYTTMSLHQRLAYHREHGNRIIHEFILGSQNILRVQTKVKSHETLVKDDMLLYKHSARCPFAIQLFVDCNPQYWSFIPMLQNEVERDNQLYQLPSTIPEDPSSLLATSNGIRSDHETGYCLNDLPPFPSNKYTFSLRQRAEQFKYFKNKRDLQMPNFNLDLYNATIIAVLPENCSTALYRLLEALFITHTQTKLNTLGHLDCSILDQKTNSNNNITIKTDVIIDRGDWCSNLLHRPTHP